MSKHEQMLEASIHFWVLREEKRTHEPDQHTHCCEDDKCGASAPSSCK